MNTIITGLDSLLVDTRIGVSDEERLSPQKLRVSFKLYQKKTGIINDDNADHYNCYASIALSIKKYCASKEFILLEYLCYELYDLIKKQVKFDTNIYIKVEKLGLKYEGLVFNASAEYSDL